MLISRKTNENSLYDALNGECCDSLQALYFEIKLDGVTGSTLTYCNEREPYQEKFRITYMDEYEFLIEMEAGATQGLIGCICSGFENIS